MDNNKWRIFSITVVIAALIFFIGGFFAAKNIKENKADIEPSFITAKIIKEMHYKNLVPVSPNQVSKHYSIQNGIIDNCSIYTSKSSDNASELACFLLSDKAKFEELKPIITAHINKKALGFKSLNPAQYKLLQSAEIVQRGRYVLVSVGSNAATDTKLFTEILK